jgi:hypothetical protein
MESRCAAVCDIKRSYVKVSRVAGGGGGGGGGGALEDISLLSLIPSSSPPHRPDYLKAIWQVVNWKNVSERLEAAKKK